MSEMTREDALAHFGVKGMKWGVRNPERPSNRQLNKASREADKQKRVQSIDSARSRLNSGKTDAALRKAKQDYKVNKVALGSREAKKILRAQREKEYKTIDTAFQTRDGKEAAANVLVAVGATALSFAVGAALSTAAGR